VLLLLAGCDADAVAQEALLVNVFDADAFAGFDAATDSKKRQSSSSSLG
jgi:hypothetical protein